MGFLLYLQNPITVVLRSVFNCISGKRRVCPRVWESHRSHLRILPITTLLSETTKTRGKIYETVALMSLVTRQWWTMATKRWETNEVNPTITAVYCMEISFQAIVQGEETSDSSAVPPIELRVCETKGRVLEKIKWHIELQRSAKGPFHVFSIALISICKYRT